MKNERMKIQDIEEIINSVSTIAPLQSIFSSFNFLSQNGFKLNVLMTGAGAPGGPGIIKALNASNKINLIVADADENASGRYLNEKFELIPKASDFSFLFRIAEICNKHDIHVIFPLVTSELFVLAKFKKLFRTKGIRVILSGNDQLVVANNKSKLYAHLAEKGIAVPEFYVVKTVSEFKKAAKKLGYPGKEFCFKPSVSNGSRGFRIVSGKVDEFDLLFNHKPNETFITFERALNILSSGKFPELLVSEYLPFDEFTVDTIIKNGKPGIILPRRRIKMREGISIQGEFEEHKEIIKYCKQIIKSIRLHGPVGIQVKRGRDGRFKILEINPRIQGTSVAAMGMGINLPLISVLQEFDLEKELIPKEIKWGTKFVRYYSEVFY